MNHKKRNYSVGRTVPFEMINYKWYLMVSDDTGWYLVSISWYCLVLGGRELVCLYILDNAENWSGVTNASLTHTHTDNRM